jgi:hypothetical protein
LTYPSPLKAEATCFSKTLVDFHQTWCYIPEDITLLIFFPSSLLCAHFKSTELFSGKTCICILCFFSIVTPWQQKYCIFLVPWN